MWYMFHYGTTRKYITVKGLVERILQTQWNNWTKYEIYWWNAIKSQHRFPWIKAKIISYKKEKNYSKTSTAVFLTWLTVKSKTKDWLLYFYISINPVLWIWPQVLIHITMDVFISQTSWEESSGMVNPGLTLVCRDVIACVIHGLEKGGLFVRAPIIYTFHLHVEKNSSIGLRKGEYGGKYRVVNCGWAWNHACTIWAWWNLTLSHTMT